MKKHRRRSMWIRLLILAGVLGASLGAVAVAAAPVATVVGQNDGDDPDDGEISDFCLGPEYTHVTIDGLQHPVGARLSEGDDQLYEQIMEWFCDDSLGFGQIKLALATAELLGEEADAPDAQALLDERLESGLGWGQIWLEHHLIGWGRRAATPDDGGIVDPDDDEADRQGPPDHAGPPEHAGPKVDQPDDQDDDGGPPDWAGPKSTTSGPPGQVGKDDDGGPPAHSNSRHNR